MRILVTGGAGFIGSHFVRHIVKNPEHSLIVLDAMTYAANASNLTDVWDSIEFLHGDIRSYETVDYAMSRCDLVVHFAAESHVDRSLENAQPFAHTNVVGTQMLVDAAVRHDIHRFVHVSTDEVYGSIREGSWTEESPLAPRSPYAATKAASDLVVLAARHTHGLDTVITRGSNTYGPHQYPEKLIPRFATALLRGRKAPLYGTGVNVRDWLHVEDHVMGISQAMDHGDPGEVYNLGGMEEHTNIEVTDIILRTRQLGWENVEFVPDRQGHDYRYSLDSSKANSALHWNNITERREFHRAIPETVRWYRDNRSWWEPTFMEGVHA